MNNDRIRFSILCQYYRAKFSGKRPPYNLELDGVDEINKNVNIEYLVDKGLINGTKQYVGDGSVNVFPADITADGMDQVEETVRGLLDDLKPDVKAGVEDDSILKILDKLGEKLSKVQPRWNL